MTIEVKHILGPFIERMPKAVFGPERVNYIIDHFNEFNNNDKLYLLDVMNNILTDMIEREASDIEFGGHGTDDYVWMRVYGKKDRVMEIPRFSADETACLIINLLNDSQRESLLLARNLDFSYTFLYARKNAEIRFRADAYFDLDRLSLNMRAINSTIRPVESLEFHQNAIRSLSHHFIKFGLSLVTGITGSGKSSTLDSIIDFHNKTDNAHIVIIASPIEFVHKSNQCIIRHREVGRDVLSFKDGVIQALRQDPDIIVIGEMRDPDTILAALEITDTGHKVFSTLHTSSAVESIDRIIAEVHPNEQERVRNRLADVLISIVSQKLVPSLDGKRALAKEVLIVNPSIKAAIKNNNTGEIYMMINQGGQNGMITMEQDLKRLYMHKKISLDNAMAYANNKTRMQQILSAI